MNVTSPASPAGSLILGDAYHDPLEPAPITPINAPPYKLLAGTVRAAYANGKGKKNGGDLFIAPGTMVANTGNDHLLVPEDHSS